MVCWELINMKNIISSFILILYAAIVGAPLVCANDQLSLGFQESWAKSSIDFNTYEEIYIYNIDLRGMKIETTGISDDDFVKYDVTETVVRGMDERKSEKIAYTIYRQFFDKLNAVMPVNSDEVDTKDSKGTKALVVDFKLSAIFSVGYQGRLQTAMFGTGGPSEPTMLTIECKMSDSPSGEKIFTFSDKMEFVSQDKSDPFSSPQDYDELARIVDLWAIQLADFLAQNKK